ncbi:unnamed protein product [Rhizoctonia solani]|uniref:Transmembrane protein n=1 Tax=Rhizoctonia solani TaxID=456999 RepID=A0A8H3DSJ9_9AGAM|nr:unnamed protein product [Rhizoctonia solani]
MIAFTRLTTFLLFVLSLGFLACAAPTSDNTQALAVRSGDCNALVDALVDLEVKLKAHLDVCVNADVLADVNVNLVAKVVADVDVCTKAVLAIGAIADVDAKIKLDIIAHIAVIVKLVAQILIKISAKLSVSVMAKICAQIDLCLKALLVALNVCIDGVVGLALKAIVDLTVVVFIKVKLVLCADILGLVKVVAVPCHSFPFLNVIAFGRLVKIIHFLLFLCFVAQAAPTPAIAAQPKALVLRRQVPPGGTLPGGNSNEVLAGMINKVERLANNILDMVDNLVSPITNILLTYGRARSDD